MADVIRLIASRLREYVGNRRSATRYPVRVHCSVSLVERQATPNGKRPSPVLTGHSEDISATGIGFFVPAIRIGEYHLAADGRTLSVALELPTGMVHMKAIAVRYERQETDGVVSGYHIGARITEMAEDDHVLFTAYLSKVASGR